MILLFLFAKKNDNTDLNEILDDMCQLDILVLATCFPIQLITFYYVIYIVEYCNVMLN